jgi:small-conductance mechanosensitive channel
LSTTAQALAIYQSYFLHHFFMNIIQEIRYILEKYDYILVSFFAIFCGVIVLKIIRVANRKFIIESSKAIRLDQTRYRFLNNATTFIVYTVVAIVITNTVPQLKSVALTLFAGASIFAAIIGFASQQAFSNIVSGIFLVVFRPFRVGDIIKVENHVEGLVEDITLRHTVIRNFENCRAIIPNTVIGQNTIINYAHTDEAVCRFLHLSLPFEIDVDRAIEVLREVAGSHPDYLDRRTAEEIEAGVPKVIVRTTQFNESGIVFRINVWGKDAATSFATFCDLHHQIKSRFDKEGFTLSYPNRKIQILEPK